MRLVVERRSIRRSGTEDMGFRNCQRSPREPCAQSGSDYPRRTVLYDAPDDHTEGGKPGAANFGAEYSGATALAPCEVTRRLQSELSSAPA